MKLRKNALIYFSLIILMIVNISCKLKTNDPAEQGRGVSELDGGGSNLLIANNDLDQPDEQILLNNFLSEAELPIEWLEAYKAYFDTTYENPCLLLADMDSDDTPELWQFILGAASGTYACAYTYTDGLIIPIPVNFGWKEMYKLSDNRWLFVDHVESVGDVRFWFVLVDYSDVLNPTNDVLLHFELCGQTFTDQNGYEEKQIVTETRGNDSVLSQYQQQELRNYFKDYSFNDVFENINDWYYKLMTQCKDEWLAEYGGELPYKSFLIETEKLVSVE